MHGHVHHAHVVVMGVNGRVVMVPVVVVVVVERGQVLQGGHVGCRRQPGHDHLLVHPALGWTWRVAGVGRDEQGGLYRLGLWRGRGVGRVLVGGTDSRPLGVGDGLRRRADSLP